MGKQYYKKQNECLLCKREKITKWYYEDDLFWVADCKICKVPMIVSKRHTIFLKPKEWEGLEKVFEELEKKGIDGIHDYRRGSISNHWHLHIR